MPDTIAALATSTGLGALSVVRLAGSDSLSIVRQVARTVHASDGTFPTDRHATYAIVTDPQTGLDVDEVVVTAYHAPRSYTGDDMVEISCHGGRIPAASILRVLLGAGARPAHPGEFTRRAFENGRIDLSQAEAVADIVHAATDAQARQALRQLRGGLGQRVSTLRDGVLDVLAAIEASIDFPDEVEEPDRSWLASSGRKLTAELQNLLASAPSAMLLRTGASVVITGAPNVGKSSLLNAMAGCDRAIVTPYPGTTRDLVVAEVDLLGVPVTLTDTAGIRESADPVEQIGVRIAQQALETADLVLAVHDVREYAPLDAGDGSVPVLHCWNKADLMLAGESHTRHEAFDPDCVVVSALTGMGIDSLIRGIVQRLVGTDGPACDGLVTRESHRAALCCAVDCLQTFDHGLVEEDPLDLLASSLRGAASNLGTITGASVTADLVDRVFHDFCVGK